MICFYAFSRPNRKQHDYLRRLSIIQSIKKTPASQINACRLRPKFYWHCFTFKQKSCKKWSNLPPENHKIKLVLKKDLFFHVLSLFLFRYGLQLTVVSLLLGKYFMFWKLRYNILTFGINKVFFLSYCFWCVANCLILIWTMFWWSLAILTFMMQTLPVSINNNYECNAFWHWHYRQEIIFNLALLTISYKLYLTS